MAYLRSVGYYERSGMGVYPGPRARLRGLRGLTWSRGLAQDDDDEIPDISDSSVPMLTTDQISALSTSSPSLPVSTAMPSPITGSPSPSLTPYATTAAPTINSPLAVSGSALTSLSTSIPSLLNATVGGTTLSTGQTIGGMTVSTLLLYGGLAVLAIAAFGAGTRRR